MFASLLTFPERCRAQSNALSSSCTIGQLHGERKPLCAATLRLAWLSPFLKYS